MRSDEAAVVGVAAGFGAQDGDGVVGDGVPVDEELGRPRVEEQEPGHVGRLHRIVEHVGVEGVAEPVGGEDVEPAVAHVGGGAGHRVEDLLHRRPHPFLGRTPPRRPARGRGADEVEQVGAFGFVELQRARDAFEDVLGDAAGVAAFEAGVVLDADPGEHARPLRGAGP